MDSTSGSGRMAAGSNLSEFISSMSQCLKVPKVWSWNLKKGKELQLLAAETYISSLRKNRQDLAFWFVKSTALIDSNPFLSRWNDTFWQLSSFYCRFSWTPKNPAKKYRIPLNFSMFFFSLSPPSTPVFPQSKWPQVGNLVLIMWEADQDAKCFPNCRGDPRASFWAQKHAGDRGFNCEL